VAHGAALLAQRIRARFERAGCAMTTTRDEVFQLVRGHLSEELGIEASTIHESTRFKEDLEADSLDLVELVVELEDRYGIRISDEQAERIETVGNAVDFVLSHVPAGSG
jgi:acyl carrier protein